MKSIKAACLLDSEARQINSETINYPLKLRTCSFMNFKMVAIIFFGTFTNTVLKKKITALAVE